VVRRRRARGYTMMEIVITMALFGVFLFIIVTMTAEMRRNEKKWPVNFFAHPEVGSVLARMRRDIYDSTVRPDNFLTFSSSPLTLIVYTINNDGTAETVVWDFTTPGEVHRKAFKATLLSSEWMAGGLPLFTATTEPMPSGQDAIRIQAMDKEKKLAIDELIVPRPHA
jgi:prepilin-type N-terminal cleavage/methylation domain-containing protein